jgi:glycosyltransferase involved in cell wall biosynthesis
MSDLIRVLYYYPYLNFDTGSPKAMAQFIETLDRAIFQPVYCATESGPLTEALQARGVEIVPGNADAISFRNPLAAALAIRRQAALLKAWGIHLLHANCFPWNTDLILAAWMLRIPVILHVHNAIDISFQNMVRFAARKVLFCSHFEMSNCGHFNRIAAKGEVLHNTMDIEAAGRGRSIRASLGLRDDEIAIGTVAQIIHRKGMDILLETARLLLSENNKLIFLIAGPIAPAEEEYGRRIIAASDEPPLRGRVRFLGSRNDIPDFMASLDLFVLPSRAEPLGLVVLEAMAAGVPVIASRIGGIPEIITSGDLGILVDPLTPEAFAGAIREVLRRPDLGKSMGDQARFSLKGRFDIGTGGVRLKKVYLSALNGHRSQFKYNA